MFLNLWTNEEPNKLGCVGMDCTNGVLQGGIANNMEEGVGVGVVGVGAGGVGGRGDGFGTSTTSPYN
jgi:hypothetical protein